MAIDHKGVVKCRGILIESKAYRRGEKLSPEHEQMLLTLFRHVLDSVDTNGWISVSGSHINVVLFSSTEPFWLQ